MSAPTCQEQEVLEVVTVAEQQHADRGAWRRRVIAGPAGLALLLAGGGLLIRVTLLTLQNEGITGQGWLFTAIACLLAGVALVLIALPRVVNTHAAAAHDEPAPDNQTG